MSLDQLIASIFTNTTFLLVIKFFAIAFLLIHLAFSIILVRQTNLMNHVIEARISPIINSIAVVHLLVSILVLLFAIFFI